jgi:hypothetical protein
VVPLFFGSVSFHWKEESIAMATAAQIEANRRNSQKSTGPRTEAGKHQSRMNSLDHGCRANLLVLPTEEFGEFEVELAGWRRSIQPRNPAEEFLVERLVSLGWLKRRIERAHTARLNKRISEGEFDEGDREVEQVLALTQRLFPDACLPQAFQTTPEAKKAARAEAARGGDVNSPIDPCHADVLVNRLHRTRTGCRWLLGQWQGLRAVLERGQHWIASDKLKAIRMLGCRPTDAHDEPEVAQIYIATHVLAGNSGDPFQEILDELSPEQSLLYTGFLRERDYVSRLPSAAAAKQMLLDIIDRHIEPLQHRADGLDEIADRLAPYAADRLSWDDTPEGERLRRYEMRCGNTWFRLFDLLHKVRNQGGRLELAAVAAIGESVRVGRVGLYDTAEPALPAENAVSRGATDSPALPNELDSGQETAPTEANCEMSTAPNEANCEMSTAPNEANCEMSTAPNEANCEMSTAPNEANCDAPTGLNEADRELHRATTERRNRPREYRLDTPHFGGRVVGPNRGAKSSGHSVLDQVLGARDRTLLNLSGIFDTR